ncbi:MULTISPECIES: DUF6314 family protein [Streptomyces]|uniref:DUF6314 family protein n=1 Tax=Streptomyces flaveolus TaxID=67297 RepID=A0ABV3A482_9ACTN|nr:MULTISPECIES: DUF6314 family protein [Streptomyces]KMS89446.1 hypothetical protein ACZ91_21140 [Streptomyces regensis]KOG63680.1 hypothetical protein ADK77_23135 [Streptomyces antibioticus]
MTGEFWPVPDVLAHLAGRWRVEREVRDLASGDDGHFTGTTVFTALDGGGLLHEESGTFTWRGIARPATRTLRFLPGSGPGRAEVRFADGRPFHELDLTTGRYVADHPCAADLYRGEFTVRDADHWRTVWRVGGPAKDLVLTTDYVRQGATGESAGTASRSGPESSDRP